MMAPQAAKCFRQWVLLIAKYSRAGAIMQAGIKRDIILTPSLTTLIFKRNVRAKSLCGKLAERSFLRYRKIMNCRIIAGWWTDTRLRCPRDVGISPWAFARMGICPSQGVGGGGALGGGTKLVFLHPIPQGFLRKS